MADPALQTFLKDRESLIAMACRVVESRAIAEELVQDTWLRWDKRSYPADKARPIFRRIVANLAIDWTRSRKTERQVLSELLLADSPSVCSERVVIARQDLRRVIDALDQLPRRSVKAFRMRFIDGLTSAEIGRRLGISLSRAHALTEEALVQIALSQDD
ncbi:MAG: sigma-70 family RNA polymerase sigma factor [Pseudomonadota bacterium]